MSFPSISFPEPAATIPSGPCTGAPGDDSPLGAHLGQAPGHGSPQVIEAQRVPGCYRSLGPNGIQFAVGECRFFRWNCK